MNFSLKKVAVLFLGVCMMVSQLGAARADGRDVAAGVAGGIIGLGILGAVAQSDARARYYRDYCHLGPMECHEVRRPCFTNSFGEHICPEPRERCFRREYCD